MQYSLFKIKLNKAKLKISQYRNAWVVQSIKIPQYKIKPKR